MKRKYKVRKLFNDIHLWLGLSSGIILFVVCLSGTVYTFQKEIIQFAEPEKFEVVVPDNATRLAAGTLITQVEEHLKGRVTAIEMSDNPTATYKVTVSAPIKANDEKKGAKSSGRGKAYYVDPYTGTVKGADGGKTKEFFTTVMKLHRWLLIEGGTGRVIVGSATIIFVLLTLTGILLWFPAKIRYWKQGLKIKTNGNWKRINHDLHNTLGFYSFILLLIMGLTGLCWSFDWYRDGVSSVMGAEVFKGRSEKAMPSVAPAEKTGGIGVDEAIQTASEVFSYQGTLRVSLPQGPEDSYVVTKHKTGFFALAASDKLQLDQYSGQQLKLERFSDKKLNEQLVASIKPLHLGEIYGTFSKILYFIACLFATSLPVTGTIIWINKLRKKPTTTKSTPELSSKAEKRQVGVS